MAGWKEYRSLSEGEIVPRAPQPTAVGLWNRSRLIQGVQGAKSLDATSRWCRPPSMAGEQGWSGAALRANLDVKRETQRASAGAHRVACFESPSCLLQPGLPWPLLSLGRKGGSMPTCTYTLTYTHTLFLSHSHTDTDTHTERGREREEINRERVTDSEIERAREKAASGHRLSGLSHAPNLRPLRISRNTIQHSASDKPTLVISGGNQKSAGVPEPTVQQSRAGKPYCDPGGPRIRGFQI